MAASSGWSLKTVVSKSFTTSPFHSSTGLFSNSRKPSPVLDSVEGTIGSGDTATLGTLRGGTGAERSEASGGAEQSEASERPGLAPSGVQSAKNGAGGINGGITNGAPIMFRVAFKPTSSIAKTQKTLNIKTGETVSLNVPGRHDVCFALRTPVIVEAVAAIVLADLAYNI